MGFDKVVELLGLEGQGIEEGDVFLGGQGRVGLEDGLGVEQESVRIRPGEVGGSRSGHWSVEIASVETASVETASVER